MELYAKKGDGNKSSGIALWIIISSVIAPIYVSVKMQVYYDLVFMPIGLEAGLFTPAGVLFGVFLGLFLMGRGEKARKFQIYMIISQIIVVISFYLFPQITDFGREWTLKYFVFGGNLVESVIPSFEGFWSSVSLFLLILWSVMEILLYWIIVYGIPGLFLTFLRLICSKAKNKTTKSIKEKKQRINQEEFKVKKCKKCGQKILWDRSCKTNEKCPRCGYENIFSM